MGENVGDGEVGRAVACTAEVGVKVEATGDDVSVGAGRILSGAVVGTLSTVASQAHRQSVNIKGNR